jgi:hypothetical protein
MCFFVPWALSAANPGSVRGELLNKRQVIVVSASLVIAFIVCAAISALMVAPSDRNFLPLLLGSWAAVVVIVVLTQKWKR